MRRSVTAVLMVALGLALAGCGMFGEKKDDRRNWQAADFYRAAKDELDSGNWLAATKLYAELEAKFPYGKYAQQAQLDTAYAFYKEGDAAQSISALDRFTKAYPNHPNLDYALYLKALANFKEDLGPLASSVARQDIADRDPKAMRESFDMFKSLVTRFPDSRYVADSLRRMDILADALARLGGRGRLGGERDGGGRLHHAEQRYHGQRETEQHRSRVSHEDRRRVEVVAQKTEA